MYLIVDTYSVLGQILHLKDEEFGIDVTFEGTKFHIPSIEVCVERSEEMFQAVIDKLNIDPQKIIMVCDPEETGTARKRIYPEYKAGRQKRPKQYYEVFNSLVSQICEFVMKSGGIKATPRVVPSAEGDDLVYELCKRLPETTIWSTDKDFFAFPATHHYIGGVLDDCKFPVPQDLILTYRAIVTGDASDNIPSAKGFGEKAWGNSIPKSTLRARPPSQRLAPRINIHCSRFLRKARATRSSALWTSWESAMNSKSEPRRSLQGKTRTFAGTALKRFLTKPWWRPNRA